MVTMRLQSSEKAEPTRSGRLWALTDTLAMAASVTAGKLDQRQEEGVPV